MATKASLLQIFLRSDRLLFPTSFVEPYTTRALFHALSTGGKLQATKGEIKDN